MTFFDIAVGGAKIEGIVPTAASGGDVVLIRQGFTCCRLRIDVGHVHETRDATGDCSD